MIKYSLRTPNLSRLTVFLALFYAFATRSILGPMIFHGLILWLYYGVLYAGLFYCLVHSFVYEAGHLYAPKFFFTDTSLFLIIAFGLYRTGDLRSLLHYGIALLLPFALRAEIKKKATIGKAIVGIGVILFVGCLINYLFPVRYSALILRRFTESDQRSLKWQASFGVYFPGFTSQVGYTSFFLSIAMGALFSFRKNVFRHRFIPLAAVLIFGMFLTGKRGPIVYMMIGLLVLYFLERRGKERFVRVFKIALIIVVAYFLLGFLAKHLNNAGIARIYDSVHEFVTTTHLEDEGRKQLKNQALQYFESHALTGIGWKNFKKLFTLRNTHVHNIYFQLLCETGIIGFVVFILFFINNLIRTIKKIELCDKHRYEYAWLMFALFVQTYFLLYGITGNPLYDIEETILYFFAIGICNLPLLPAAEEGEKCDGSENGNALDDINLSICP